MTTGSSLPVEGFSGEELGRSWENPYPADA